MVKFLELHNSDTQTHIRKLGAFIQKAFTLRTDLLY